ncbi:MAG: hypothetical protein HKM05_08970 [Spirochaetales bacterium]|nr:hypothetical protein [Spirochaetales bacterium]
MIRPLDLQAIYMNLDKVSKEHSLSRNHVINQQTLEAQKLLKLHEADKNAVQSTQATEESSNEGAKVRTDEEDTEREAQGQFAKKHQPPEEEKPQDEKWTDTRLGAHVDLTS